MITPSHTAIETLPFDIASSGDNIIVPLFVPATGLKLGATYVHSISLFPAAAVTVTLKAVNTVTTAARLWYEDMPLTAAQPFILENASPDSVYLYSLLPDEELVVELSSAVRCTGFTNASYFIG
mgnify:CR=1 FL=1